MSKANIREQYIQYLMYYGDDYESAVEQSMLLTSAEMVENMKADGFM